MKGRTLKLPVLNADELMGKASPGASALVVAEGKASLTSLTRRIALGWMSGECDFAQLRNAAAHFPETAFFAAADASVEHRNGAMFLQNDRRCRMSWSVRAIPLDLVRCFSRYEDATEIPPAEVKSETSENGTDNHADVVPERGAELPRAPLGLRIQPTAAPVPAPITPAAPSFHPLAELTINRKRAFTGNCAGPQSPYITDGRMLFLKSACEARFAQSKTVDSGRYGPTCPAPDEHMKKIFDAAVKNATVDAEIMGYASANDVGVGENDEPLACIATRQGNIIVIDGDRLAFVQQKTGADAVRVESLQPEKHPVVLFKAGQPVAVVITCFAPAATAAFKKMISAGQRPANLASE